MLDWSTVFSGSQQNTNQQGGVGGVPLPDGSRKEYYANGGDGKADWNRRPTWKEFCEAFAKVAILDGDEKHKTAYATMSRMRQTRRIRLHNQDFYKNLCKCTTAAIVEPKDVTDFRIIETYINTLAKRSDSKLKAGKEESIYAVTLKGYEKGKCDTLQQAFDRALKQDQYLQKKAESNRPRPLKSYLPGRRKKAKDDDSSDDGPIMALGDADLVTMQQVQQVAESATNVAVSGLEKRIEAKLEPVKQDLDTLKVNITEVTLGMKTLLSRNETAAAPPPAMQQQQYQQQKSYQQQQYRDSHYVPAGTVCPRQKLL